MIQLATHIVPNPKGWRPASPGDRADPSAPRRRRSGRTWPFLIRPSPRPAATDAGAPCANPASAPRPDRGD